MKASVVNQIFEIFAHNNPYPKTELKYQNNFTLLIAVVLSAQATDKSVNKVTEKLFITHNTPEKILELGEEGLKDYIKSIGLYNNKAVNIIKLCEKLINQYHGTVPNNFEDLIKLDGVGRKTANVILNCLFDIPTIAVDTHVFRVSKRIGLATSNNPISVEKELLTNIPTKWHLHAHHWLILHGRYICIAMRPKCSLCSIQKYCKYFQSIKL